MTTPHSAPLISAGILLGTGLGGFVDGIVLHQILQWHNMLSCSHPPTDLVAMKYNMVWDGLFHAFTWVVTALGLWRLWSAGKRSDVPWSGRTFVGSMCAGWGIFNVIEGLIDHQILGIHHVHPGDNQFAWDLGFIAFGVALIVFGWLMIRTGRLATMTRGGSDLSAGRAPMAQIRARTRWSAANHPGDRIGQWSGRGSPARILE